MSELIAVNVARLALTPKTDIKRAQMKYINDRVVGDLENGNSKPFCRHLIFLCQDSFGVPALEEA